MTGWRVHAWVLMGNHYHLFIETPEANLVEGMKWLQNAYTRRFNVRHGKWGRLFGDRYKAVVVEGAAGDYYRTLLDYIHLNPVRAGIVVPQRGQSVMDFPWSSVAGRLRAAAGPSREMAGCGTRARGARVRGHGGGAEAVHRAAGPAGGGGGGGSVRGADAARGSGCAVQPSSARVVLGHAGVWREADGRAEGRSESAQGAFLPERAGAAFARSRAGGGVVEDWDGSSRSPAGGNQATAGQRCSEGGAGEAAVDGDDGVARLDCGAARDGKRGEREPATPAREDGQTAPKAAPCIPGLH